MVVIHRPSVFETVDLSAPEGVGPKPQPSFSLVCAVKDTVEPDRVVDKITQNLRFFGLEPALDAQNKPVKPGGNYKVAALGTSSGDTAGVVSPAYAALSEGGRYFVFTSNVENMDAILAAARDPEARLLAEPGVLSCVGQLPAEGTLSILARGGTLRSLLEDDVRRPFRDRMDVLEQQWNKEKVEQGIKDPDEVERLVAAESDSYMRSHYPSFRDDFRRRVAPFARIDTALVGMALGVGPSKVVSGGGFVLVRKPGGASQ
jgi:hypothetical protein